MKRITIITAFIVSLMLPSALVMAQNSSNNKSSNSNPAYGNGMGMMQNRMSQNGMMQGGMMGMMRGQMMGQRGAMRGGMMAMMRGRMIRMLNNPWMRMRMSVYGLPNLDTLGLNASQKSKLSNYKSNYVKNIQDSRKKLTDLQSKLSGAISASDMNIKNVRKLINQRSETQAKLQLSMIETYHNMFGVLNSSQQKKLQGMNSQAFMIVMMNSVPMGQMMAFCQSNGSGRQGMMNGMMGGKGVMRGNMMNGVNPNSMMN